MVVMFWWRFPWCRGGFGRGWRHMYWATGLPGWLRFGWSPLFAAGGAVSAWRRDLYAEWLRGYAGFLESQLDALRAQIGALQGNSKEQQ
ncbi:DUF5320 domain-containing protein [Thermanaeromonas toyohensis]|uniref:DUF5320 domain-containing protein n=1 Tax=Thermanaeromonas toyohensis TaxID=161154 RepID=UPI0012F52123|nr:DUF5320 domain-containing protein [Thermanaeromonas toyohensis]